MGRRDRLRGVVVIIALLIAARLGYQTYRWFAYDEERARIEALTASLEEAALQVVRTQLATDSLRAAVERMDAELERTREAVEAYQRHSIGGGLPEHLYRAYRADLERHNRSVMERNASFDRWREVLERNHAAVSRYNALADSIRATAAEIGEPYYSIPTPAEIAVEHGISPRR